MRRLCVSVCFVVAAGVAHGQELLDRVVARVDGRAVTLSDVRAAAGLGLVEASGGDPNTAVLAFMDRLLVLAEVARFSPPQPDQAAIEREAGALEARAGAQLESLMRTTGITRQGIREFARDNLRINAYLTQRFGLSVQVTDEEIAEYYRSHPDEFRRNGELIPFPDAEPQAREAASAARRRTTVDLWIRDLRQRANIRQNK